MKNVVYRTGALGIGNEKLSIEFYVSTSKVFNPEREIKELEIEISGENTSISADLNEEELDSLVDFLQDCRRHVMSFNESTKVK